MKTGNNYSFSSIDDLGNYIVNMRDYVAGNRGNEELHFYGQRLSGCAAQLHSDYTKHKAQIDALIDQMNFEGIFTTGLPMPERAYYGSRPNVGAYLSGLPKNMWRRVESENQSLATPISIFVDTAVSQGVPESKIVQRGVALNALAAAFRTFRPVNLYAVSSFKSSREVYVKVQLSENTLDFGRTDYILTSNDFCRRIMFNFLGEVQGRYSGCNWVTYPGSQTYRDLYADKFGITSQDIFIEGGLFSGGIMDNPIQWIKDMVEKYSVLQEN